MKIKKLANLLLATVAAFAITSCSTDSPVGLETLGSSSNSAEPNFHLNFDTAFAEAQKTGKPIVTIFSASWCPPCQTMKKHVYPSTEVAPFHDQFVWAYLDADQYTNQSLMAEHQVEGIPHISFVSANGAKLGQTVGGMGSREFAGMLSNVLGR